MGDQILEMHVFARVADLEACLGAKLLLRTTHVVVMTDGGTNLPEAYPRHTR